MHDDGMVVLSNSENVRVDDYVQSANALFHFMKRGVFLENALLNKALLPRYCIEDVRYLNIKNQNSEFHEIAVLQKCFCDIPLHKLVATTELSLTADSEKLLHDISKSQILEGNNHPGFYGNYAIAFSKNWCEINNLQPVHYLNPRSTYTRDFSTLVSAAISSDELSDKAVADILQRLSLVKPLRGKMRRKITIDGKEKEVEFEDKNFHDEQEWRYVPDIERLADFNEANQYKIESVIANPNKINMQIGLGENYVDLQSNKLVDCHYDFLWLKFDYSHIKYLIVPHNQARLDIIQFILSLPSSNFNDAEKEMQEKYVLISKILMLEEVRKDW